MSLENPLYNQDLEKYPPLNHSKIEELEKILMKAKEEKDELTIKHVQDKLVESHLRLAVKITKQFQNLPPGLDHSELEQIAGESLVRAAQEFDPIIAKFSTFATTCIEHAIIYEIKKAKTQKRTQPP